jgi:AcrR family transcriptional regulator
MLRSRAALRAALLKLLVRDSYEAISIRDITREAGVGSATYYRHYQDKGELLDDIAAEQMKALIDASIPVYKTTGSRDAARALCLYVERHKELWTLLLSSGAAGAMRMAFTSHLRQVSPPAAMPSFKSPEDLRLSVSASGVIEVLSWWLVEARELKAQKIAEFLDELVIGPASVNTAPRKSSSTKRRR